jgi:uncharacterized protein (DUF924 family)
MDERSETIERVLAFWLDPKPQTAAEAETRKAFWFSGNDAVDRDIRDKFGALVELAHAGQLSAWHETPRGTLAWMILVDQFSRNVFRGSPRAYAADAAALELARAGFASDRFAGFDTVDRMFLALPFRHAEDVDSQKRAVELAVADALAAPAHLLDFAVYSVDWARKHLDVIVRFGRFPHRNEVCGRTSTAAELEYLAYLKRAGQWL